MRSKISLNVAMTARRVSLGLLIILTLGACLDPIPRDTITEKDLYSLSGRVLDACDQSPVAFAVVTAQPAQSQTISKSTTTDEKGAFFFPELAEGTWIITALKQNLYRPEPVSVNLVKGQNQTVNLKLFPEPKEPITSIKLDLLFVVDNSPSMGDKQRNLVSAFPAFMSAIKGGQYAMDVRLGVISTDLGVTSYTAVQTCSLNGDQGKLQTQARLSDCVGPTDPWIAFSGSSSNVPGNDLESAFSCIAKLGEQGCGFEQPLLSIKTALSGTTNPNFLRSDAVLAVVILTDEDDCSAVDTTLFDPSQKTLNAPLGPLDSFRCTEFGLSCDEKNMRSAGEKHHCKPAGHYLIGVEEFTSWFRGVKPTKSFLGVIAGPVQDVIRFTSDGQKMNVEPSCSGGLGVGVAYPAIRLKDIADALSPNSSFDIICNQNLEPTLQALATKIITSSLQNTCESR